MRGRSATGTPNGGSALLPHWQPVRSTVRFDSIGREREDRMEQSISRLVEMAKSVRMNDAQREEQRNSFVYGNTKIENEEVTLDLVEKLSREVALPAE